jgi:hypothetical protein
MNKAEEPTQNIEKETTMNRKILQSMKIRETTMNREILKCVLMLAMFVAGSGGCVLSGKAMAAETNAAKDVAGQQQTREPKVSFDKAVEIAKEAMKQRALDELYFISRVAYETHGEAPPRWMFILSPKPLRAPKAEPGLLIGMDGTVTMVKGR